MARAPPEPPHPFGHEDQEKENLDSSSASVSVPGCGPIVPAFLTEAGVVAGLDAGSYVDAADVEPPLPSPRFVTAKVAEQRGKPSTQERTGYSKFRVPKKARAFLANHDSTRPSEGAPAADS